MYIYRCIYICVYMYIDDRIEFIKFELFEILLKIVSNSNKYSDSKFKNTYFRFY